jgi:hypothetical protein
VEPDPNTVNAPQIPPEAAKAGLRGDVPYQLYPPAAPGDRLLYAILAELQRMNYKLGKLTNPPDQEMSAEDILHKGKKKESK